MNLAQSKKSIEKLKKVRDIVEVSKYATLHEISKITKISKNALEISSIAQSIFESAHNRFKINSHYYSSGSNRGTLWVFVTFNKTLLSAGYERHTKILRERFDVTKDKLIVVGDVAIKFAEKQNIEPILSIKEISNEEITRVSNIITHYYDEYIVTGVKFVLHTGRNPEGVLTVLPIDHLDVGAEEKFNANNIRKFYPSLVDVMDNLTRVYVAQTSTAIIYEAHYYYLKEKLVRHEESLKSVDERIELKHNEYIKTMRKSLTEELIQINQNTSRTVAKEKDDRAKESE